MTLIDVRHSPAAVSVDALARQWARQEAARPGAAYVVDTEISARRRGGVLWSHPDSTAVGVIVRPELLAIDAADLLWLAAGLGAADALGALTGATSRCRWPDGVEMDIDSPPDVAITAVYELGPGRIEYAVLVVRVAPSLALGGRSALSDALVHSLRSAMSLLDDPTALLQTYRDQCVTLGQSVSASLLPHGVARGVADTIDERGALVLRSATGLTDSVAISALRDLRPVDASHMH
ncbi:MAG: biotin-(acetyl-CoA carboxylase) ligase [Ilumatobacter sp.]|jgi:biotin-(acetyl-CoA carboxylase) ligase